MAGDIKAGVDMLVMDAKDQVATAIRDLQAGQSVTYSLSDKTHQLTLAEDIPFGHKAAIRAMDPGTEVRKYGEIIGRVTAPIPVGHHVHVHNVEGIRGRGDQARSAANQRRETH